MFVLGNMKYISRNRPIRLSDEYDLTNMVQLVLKQSDDSSAERRYNSI